MDPNTHTRTDPQWVQVSTTDQGRPRGYNTDDPHQVPTMPNCWKFCKKYREQVWQTVSLFSKYANFWPTTTRHLNGPKADKNALCKSKGTPGCEVACVSRCVKMNGSEFINVSWTAGGCTIGPRPYTISVLFALTQTSVCWASSGMIDPTVEVPTPLTPTQT